MRPFGLKWRWVLAAVVIAAILDFNGFREDAARALPGDVTDADGIVVLTGGSGLRIAAGMDLLATGIGERLLISGVNPDVTLDQLAASAGGDPGLYECCVDIGYQATTTLENAEEVSAWAETNGYDRLVLVTSNYHMPRARFLLSRDAEGVEFIAYPVTTRIDPVNAYRDWRSFRGTAQEWMKWRVTQALSLFN